MQLAVKSMFDFDRVSTTLRSLSRDPLGSLARLLSGERIESPFLAERDELRAEFGRAARVEEDLT